MPSAGPSAYDRNMVSMRQQIEALERQMSAGLDERAHLAEQRLAIDRRMADIDGRVDAWSAERDKIKTKMTKAQSVYETFQRQMTALFEGADDD